MGIRDAPTHHNHQEKSEQKKRSGSKTILDTDGLVIG